MSDASKNIRRVPVADVKQDQKRLLDSHGLVEKDYTGPVILTLNYHRGALNSMRLDKPITL